MAAMSHTSNITDLTISMPKITNGIKILINPVLTAGDVIPDSFHCYQMPLETLVVSEQRHVLTLGYTITYETNRYKTYEMDLYIYM